MSVASSIVHGLNEFNKIDPIAMDSLFEFKTRASSEKLFGTQYTTDDDGKINFIGVLNGIIANQEVGVIIGTDIGTDGKIKNFYLDNF
jgi:hypothetical protein